MLALSGYKVSRKIYESRSSVVYRGLRTSDNLPVVLKQLRNEYPTTGQVARFRREYEMTRDLDVDGVIDAYDLLPCRNTFVIILEDFGGDSLAGILASRPLAPDEFFTLAVKISEILSRIHARSIMHKDLNPSNIVWNPDTGILKIIDFGISTKHSREQPGIKNPNVLEGTLAYMSPEQTGRMNRAVDYRTDFYSLGAAFYQLLTGQLLFDTSDAMELIHSHIAKTPVAPGKINPEIPVSLSRIILKLLSKNAEDRYQSAFGLHYDLAYISKNLPPEKFEPGSHDVSGRLSIPEKLYGLENETKKLYEMYENACRGEKEILVVSGSPGVGKSALVRELHKPVTEKKGVYIEGKFDRFQKDIPYSAVLQAFGGFIDFILKEKDEQLHYWKQVFREAVGDVGCVLTNLLPALELIIGPQPELPKLGGIESRNRFNYVWINFIKAIAQPEHPLVIFADDVQWADKASLALLKNVLADPEIKYLFCILAHQRNETDFHVLDELGVPEEIPVTSLHLSGLHLHDVTRLICDALSEKKSQSLTELAGIVYAKTAGNAFFTLRFLKRIYEESLLRFDFQGRRWRWDVEKIKREQMTDNVVDLMVNTIQKLPETTQELLRIASCIGNPFEMDILAGIVNKDEAYCQKGLTPAFHENLVMPSTQHTFIFAHNRIQQAVYSTIPEEEKHRCHAEAGKRLLHLLTPEEVQKRIFDLVRHLNYKQKGLSPQEQELLCELNYQAAMAAKQSSAYEQGYHYIIVSRRLLPQDSWRTHYHFTLRVYEELAELSYLSNRYDPAGEAVRAISQKAKNSVDAVNAHITLIHSYRAQTEFKKAVETGVDVLAELGVKIPLHPGAFYIAKEFIHTQWVAGLKKTSFFAGLPEMTDKKRLAIVKIFDAFGSCVFLAMPDLLPVLSFKFMRIAVKYGNSLYSGSCYSGYSIILSVMNKVDRAVAFAGLAEKVFKQFDAPLHIRMKTRFLSHYIVFVWKKRLHTIIPAMEEVYRISIENGELEYAAYGLTEQFLAFYTNVPLHQLEQAQIKRIPTLQKLNQLSSLRSFYLALQLCENLMSPPETPCSIKGRYFDEDGEVPKLAESHDLANLFNFYNNKIYLCLVYENFGHAASCLEGLETYVMADQGSYYYAVSHFYSSLLYLQLSESSGRRKTYLKKVRNHQKKMKRWGKINPKNFQHKYDLVEAERMRLCGKNEIARELYDKAISGAEEYEFLSDEALSWQLAARFYIKIQKKHLARYYLQNAYNCYKRWNADGVCLHLEKKYPGYALRRSSLPPLAGTTTTSTDSADASFLDLNSIVKASHSLAGEVKLKKLLKNMLMIIMENAGAEYGVIIRHNKGRLTIEAKGEYSGSIDLLQSEDVEKADGVALNIVRYVARTRKHLVADNACGQAEYSGNEYIRKKQVKSVFCYPVIHKNELITLLYLENNLGTHVFTQERIETIAILSSQIAISLENALMYKTLEEKVEERTVALAHAKERAEEASHAKSTFLANMTHELRSPLNAILGFSELSARHPNIPGEVSENLGIVRRSGEHLLMLINQVLDLSKIEAGRMTLNPCDFNLGWLLDDVENMFRMKAEEKGLQLVFSCAADVPLFLRADELKLRQVIINLLNNALKFTRHGGITVRVSPLPEDECPVKTDTQFAVIRFAVEDTGPGIAPEETENIFTAFEQAHSGRQVMEGTGLGLPISRRFVQLMGGDIKVHSRVGQGTTFRFDIRAECLAENPEEAGQSQALRVIALEPGQPLYRILIADDHPMNRLLLVKLLQPLGFEIREAGNGKEAVRIWEEWKPHLIWMDLRMPEMNGSEAAKKIRNETLQNAPDAEAETKIIAITASMEEKKQAVTGNAGCDDFLRKPFRENDIFALMTKHIGVRFVYEEKTNRETSKANAAELGSALAALPPDLAEQLRYALENSDMELIDRVIGDIRTRQPAAASILREWADNFQYERILNVLQ